MREPELDSDGWCLENGEQYHANAPTTFWIPDLQQRESLEPGDLAKLIFQISVDDVAEPVAVERMWVLVRERTPSGYLGVLDNEPSSIAENDEFWLGTEIPFAPHHIIDISEKDLKSIELAKAEPRMRWLT